MTADWHASVAPEADPGEVRRALERHWGLVGTLTPLYAERDQNFRLDTDAGPFLVKLSHPDIGAERLAYENSVLVQLQQAPDAPTVPGPVVTEAGATLIDLPDVGIARVLDWLPGTPLDPMTSLPASREALGAVCARLNQALADVEPPSSDILPRDLPWDLQNLSSVAGLRDRLPGSAPDAHVGFVLERFDNEAVPALCGLSRQLVHNDLNPDNLLFDPNNPAHAPAVIDFGDMVEAPIVCDLAVACAYLVGEKGQHALSGVADTVRGFYRVRPLTGTEIDVLPLLIAGRMCQTLLIQGARVSEGQDPSGDLRQVVARAGQRLSRLLDEGLETVRRRLRGAAEFG